MKLNSHTLCALVKRIFHSASQLFRKLCTEDSFILHYPLSIGNTAKENMPPKRRASNSTDESSVTPTPKRTRKAKTATVDYNQVTQYKPRALVIETYVYCTKSLYLVTLPLHIDKLLCTKMPSSLPPVIGKFHFAEENGFAVLPGYWLNVTLDCIHVG